MNENLSTELQTKYRRIVNLFLLYDGNITYSEIQKKTGCGFTAIKHAIDHYLKYPHIYKTNLKTKTYLKPNQNETIYDCTKLNKVEEGIKTMDFWAAVYAEKQRRKNTSSACDRSFQHIIQTVISARAEMVSTPKADTAPNAD